MPIRAKQSRAQPLRLRDLRWTCPASWIPAAKARKTGGKDGADPWLAFGLLGQQRALQALELGLNVQGSGYNVFVAGLGGSDEPEKVVKLIEQLRNKLYCEIPGEHVFVHNFDDPVRPQHLRLKAGQSTALQQGMQRWVSALSREISQLLESDAHSERRHHLYNKYRRAEEQLFRRFGLELQEAKLELVQIEDENGARRDIFCRIGEQILPLESLPELPRDVRPKAAEFKRLQKLHEAALTDLNKVQRKARSLGLRLISQVQSMDAAVVEEVVQSLTLALAEEVGADLQMAAWLGDCAGYANSHPQLFLRGDGSGDDDDDDSGKAPFGMEVFEVNMVRTLGKDSGCPIVYEQHPNYSNLFGSVERHILRQGGGSAHLAVRSGSLLEADGGYLVLNARDIFRETEVWRALKRTLQTGRLEIHALEAISPLGVTGVRPAPIPLNLKLILVGSADLFESLHIQDHDFPNIFKVKAEFEETVALNRKHVAGLATSLRALGKEMGLLPFSRSGLQALAERAVNLAGRRTQISTELPILLDFAREASYFAERSPKKKISREHVANAQTAFRRMHATDSEWHLRHVLEGIYEIQTKGELIGSLNALTVISLGPLSFGRASRLSAVVSAGEESYLNIERDVDLSGPIHSKGVLMLESFMRHRFGQKRGLPVKVSLTFDQSYGPIDGDSASSTEIYALLSAIGKLPLRQDLAVTGAVNMKGEVMAVGGVNAKVRGFWELCNARGLTGTQGVILPKSNVEDLMLDTNIMSSVKAGMFHLWAIDHVDAGIAILTGLKASEVHERVQKGLETYAEALKESNDSADASKNDE